MLQVLFLKSLVALADPFFLLWNGETGEKLSASSRAGGDIQNSAENIGYLESNNAKGHFREADTPLRKFFHIRV